MKVLINMIEKPKNEKRDWPNNPSYELIGRLTSEFEATNLIREKTTNKESEMMSLMNFLFEKNIDGDEKILKYRNLIKNELDLRRGNQAELDLFKNAPATSEDSQEKANREMSELANKNKPNPDFEDIRDLEEIKGKNIEQINKLLTNKPSNIKDIPDLGGKSEEEINQILAKKKRKPEPDFDDIRGAKENLKLE